MASAAPSGAFLARIVLRKTVAQVQRETRDQRAQALARPVEPRLPRHRLHHRRRHLRAHRQCRGAARRARRPDLLRRSPASSAPSPASAMPSLPRPCRSPARPIPTATPRSASSRPGSWARCCCSNMALRLRSSRSAGRAMSSACSATSASTYRPTLTGPRAIRKDAGRRDDDHHRSSTCRPSWSAPCSRCCWCSACRNRRRSTTSSSRSR